MTKPVLVLLHGWGNDSHSWQPLMVELGRIAQVVSIDLPGFGAAQALPEFSLDAVLTWLAPQLPPKCVLMGWSLGGMLAVQLAERCPQQVVGVITLAANAKFVADDDYPAAMPPDINAQFNASFLRDPVTTLKMFTGLLTQGDDQERALLKQLRQLPPLSINANWQQALILLAAMDNRKVFARLQQPGLHLFGEKDVLVHVAAVKELSQLNSAQDFAVLPGAAHALHWSQPQTVIGYVEQFLKKHSDVVALVNQLDKKKIAQSFSRAAETYDRVAGLQRAVSQHLLATVNVKPTDVVLDLGSGTGVVAAQLAGCAEQVIALDIAEGMLQFARAHHEQPVIWLCGDAENLPLANRSVDIIFSSLAIQWCNQLPQLMMELHRVLKPGGKVYLSTLGPKSLQELKSAWREVDDYVHVNHFASEAQLQQALDLAGLELEFIERENQLLYFEVLSELTHSLKALGAHNMNPGQSMGLTGRQHLMLFKAAYEKSRTPQGLPLTYDVFYLGAKKS